MCHCPPLIRDHRHEVLQGKAAGTPQGALLLLSEFMQALFHSLCQEFLHLQQVFSGI